MALALTLVGACHLRSVTQPAQIHLPQFVHVTVQGPDGYAKAEARLDRQGLLSAMWDRSQVNLEELEACINSITLSVPDQLFGNGDSIPVTISWDPAMADSLGFELTGSSETFRVKDLQSVRQLDPFGGVSLLFEGDSPHGTARLSFDNAFPGLLEGDYQIDRRESLQNGDSITVTYTHRPELTMELGFLPTQCSKTYTVSGLPTYSFGPKSISEAFLAPLKEIAMEEIEKEFKKIGPFSGSYVGYLLLQSNPDRYCPEENILYIVYATDQRLPFVEECGEDFAQYRPSGFVRRPAVPDPIYLVMGFSNVTQTTDGSLGRFSRYLDKSERATSDLLSCTLLHFYYPISPYFQVIDLFDNLIDTQYDIFFGDGLAPLKSQGYIPDVSNLSDHAIAKLDDLVIDNTTIVLRHARSQNAIVSYDRPQVLVHATVTQKDCDLSPTSVLCLVSAKCQYTETGSIQEKTFYFLYQFTSFCDAPDGIQYDRANHMATYGNQEDQFSVICPRTDLAHVCAFLERIRTGQHISMDADLPLE